MKNTGSYLCWYHIVPKKKEPPEGNREGPNQKPLTIKPYPMKIRRQYR